MQRQTSQLQEAHGGGAADRPQAALDKLNGVLQAESECWGNDEAGSQSAADAFTGPAKRRAGAISPRGRSSAAWAGRPAACRAGTRA
ncbi:hypothetical protein [Saccharopolyspora pogona]|uniref:hypothetical protein n=1 Tax=Saccharopolyspora pogona TaxID=333966 RepID=UPI00168533E1|nr:hypothetical protein [Saccharopolyspora pogona]